MDAALMSGRDMAHCAFVPLAGASLRRAPMRSGSTTRAPSRTATKRARRSTRTMRVRRGAKPDPEIPEALHLGADMRDIDWEPYSLAQLEGKVVYAVNVASEDDYTESNYELMVALGKEFDENDLAILAFPCNWFSQKEAKGNAEIKSLVRDKYDKDGRIVLFDKCDYELNTVFALGQKWYPGEIHWNFHGKFLFGRDGLPFDRFDLLSTDDYIRQRIRAAMSRGTPRAAEEELEEEQQQLAI